jgi:polyketide synthase 12
MAAKLDEREQQRMRDAGMNALTADQALAAMGQLLKYRVAQAGVYSIDWQRLFSGDSVRSHHAVFSDLVGKQDDDNKGNLVDQLIAATADKREAIVAEATSTVLATVLGMKSAELIDRDKSIVDYGVNSLMAMDLRNRLQAVLRMKLPAAFTLKYTTVNAMVGFIIENLSLEKTTVSQNVLYWDPQKPDVVANTEINGRTATLTPFIQFWIHEGHTPHYNVGALLEIDEGLFDLGVLKTALRIMLTHHDAARSQFFEENGKLQQEIVGLDGQGDVVENDFSGLGYELGASRMLECNDALHRSFRFERGSPLFRVAYYKLDDASPHRVCLIFHHYLSDGMSLKSFGRGLIETYFKVLNNQPVELPTKSYSYLEWTRRMHQFAQHEAQAQLPYWLTQIEKSRACFVPDDFESRRERQIDDYKLYAKVIDRIEYSRLAEFWRTQGWEIADLCIYALIKAFSRRTGLERIWIDITTHARSGIFPDVTLPDLFGQVSELATLLFELVPGGTLAEQMAAIRHQRTNVPNGGIGLRALCFLNQTPEVRSQLPQDALPQIGMNIDITDYAEQNKVVGCRFAREPFGNAHGLQLRKKANELRLAFFLNLRLRDGVFSVEIGYYKDRFYHSTIECLALDFCAALLSTLRENGAIGKQENTAMPDSEAMISPIDASHNSVSEPPFVKTNESNPQFADVNK